MSVAASAKAVARRSVESAARLIARAQVAALARSLGSTPRVVLDIDNTLADTWPSFLVPHASHRERLAGLAPLPNIKAVAHDTAVADGSAVIFLSHRNLWDRPVTLRWLRTHGFAATRGNVVLVPSPADKVALVSALARGGSVTVWDDLTHGHETGTVGYYDDVIEAVTRASATYHGWADIVAVTGSSGESVPERE
ncbi:MAG: hypothetical protein U0Q22_09175 [Acidimicrobiales bacterium]